MSDASVKTSSIAALALVLLVASSARAEIMDTTGSLGSGSLSLGAEAQAALREGTPMMINAHEAVGLLGGLDLTLRQSAGVRHWDGFYLGAGVKWTLLSASSKRGRPGVATWLGGHFWTSGSVAGADASIAIDYPFGRFRPYIGLDSNLEFYDNDVEFAIGFFGGVRIGIVTNVVWFVEGGLGLAGTPKPHFISTGPKIYI